MNYPQVEVAYTLGCVVLSHHDNQEKLKEEEDFKFDVLLDLLQSSDKCIKLKAGFALSIFAFNNTPQQYAIREAGGIRYRCFEEFMDSDDEHERCNAAFQVYPQGIQVLSSFSNLYKVRMKVFPKQLDFFIFYR